MLVQGRSADPSARAEFAGPHQIFPLILGGVIFLIAGLFVLAKHDPGRASAWLTIGAGMVLYGVTDVVLLGSRWRIPGLLLMLAIWFFGVYWTIDKVLAPN